MVPYAPYIMLLIKHTLPYFDLSGDDCETHTVKNPYVKRNKSATPSAYPDTFMANARTSAPTRAQRAATAII
jgi:hypothetical protein